EYYCTLYRGGGILLF
nr:immunoglobulin light chain junction region [Macaca mulatta]MOX20445.1 immunoglobulin light chain junction region [Macaca mulatta]MOX21542.1 immunoglobulin light chain junction region [Macaca mulatta]